MRELLSLRGSERYGTCPDEMTDKKHAVLSASSAHRWLVCPPSALACAGVKDTASAYALQGTDAHSLCEYRLLKALGQKAEDPTENLKFVENIVQAISRDTLMYAMKTLRCCSIVAHVHDELIIEADKRMSLDTVCEQMGRTPPWAEGLLLRADGYETDFYKKD